MDKYSTHMIAKLQASGASPEAVQAQLQQLNKYKEMYENPLFILRKKLHQESDHAGHHECSGPYQVEIEPRLAKNREAKLAIDHPRDDPSDSKIGSSMDHGGEQCLREGWRLQTCDGDLPFGQPLRRYGCPAAPAAPSNPHHVPRPSETTRASGRGNPPACGPTAGGDAAPGNRFPDRTRSAATG